VAIVPHGKIGERVTPPGGILFPEQKSKAHQGCRKSAFGLSGRMGKNHIVSKREGVGERKLRPRQRLVEGAAWEVR